MGSISERNTTATMVLPKSLKARAIEVSNKTGAPISAIMRKALENHLTMLEKQAEPQKEAA